MQKRFMAMLLAVVMALGLCACARSAAATWQEQYDLGVRYLSEGNYREAIIAFNAAIEIDPKRADAYIGLADAYVAQGDVEQAVQVLTDALAVVADADVIRSRLDGLEGSAAPEPAPTSESTPEPTDAPEPTGEPTSEPTPEPTPEPTGGDPSSYIGLTISGGNYSNVDEPPLVVTDGFTEDWEWVEMPVTLDGCFALSKDSQLTVSNLADADEDCYITISLYTSGEYRGACYLDTMYVLPLTNNAGFILAMNGATSSPEYGGVMQLHPGESVTFSLFEYAIVYDEESGVEIFPYDFLALSIVLYYPETQQSEQAYYGFVY